MSSKAILTVNFFDKYKGRQIEIHCFDGKIFRGRVDSFDYDDDPGVLLSETELNGKLLSYDMSVPESRIKSFIPLEGENTGVHQFDAVELDDGRRVVVLDIYETPPGYEVEDVALASSEDYDGFPSFTVETCQVKRVLERAKT
jgi:small nuclear ribonucleoprotein (snRNP)-like protein